MRHQLADRAWTNDPLPLNALPLVIGTEEEERAAHAAYTSHNALLDYRATHLRDKAVLCDYTRLNDRVVQEYTVGEINRYVLAFAKAQSSRLRPRRKGLSIKSDRSHGKEWHRLLVG